MSNEELLYVKGARIWIAHVEDVWEGATLEENYHKGDTKIKIVKDIGGTLEYPLKSDGSNLPPLRNPAILIGQNDLTSLSYLHEPGVLHNLKVRFCERQIMYTYCGIILVAINPYSDLPLYGPSIIRAYRGRSIGQLEPHIFALAEEAYAKLEREKCNLSIIVSGESGAGKTVSAKYTMRYFAAVGGSESETQVERKVLASSPIMEAFGNAKTTRNDNSSRFGKFTKLLFKNDMDVMHLTGAAMNTYLLEKSRVVFQAQGERNYHIFYQLCDGRELYPELTIDHQDEFYFLNQGISPNIDKVSDKEQLKETIQAMTVLGFSTNQISDILKILAGILHLGNIRFLPKYKKDSEEIENDACDIAHQDQHLQISSELFKISSSDLRTWLITRRIDSVNEQVLIPNSAEVAPAARDALAKHIYAKLFQYIVSIINQSLNMGRTQSNFIGVLDIYGFETFEVNSFEQFCINYANEKLQQQFNQHVFKLEQDEYLREGITWTMIDYYDNQPCINLIEAKLGILDLLDEECRMPKGSDENWAGKLVDKCVKYPHFEKARFGTKSFNIKHFSAMVKYDVLGFLEKNRDTVSKELVDVMRNSQMALCQQILTTEEVDTLSPDNALGARVSVTPPKRQSQTSKQHRRSVGSQFRESLSSLINTLHATTPHYIRCIKPNDDKIAFKWEASKIVQQLRACGVLETVRISAAGFPSRWSYHDFFMRYQLLIHRTLANKANLKQSCQDIVTKWLQDDDKYRFGNTQIFFRAGQVAFMEQMRGDMRKKYIILIQSVVRRFICRRRFLKLKLVVLGIQRYAKGFMARKRIQKLREDRAGIIIAKYARGWLCRRRYVRLRNSICGIQQYARGMLARRRFQELMDHYRAVQIQRVVRGYIARRAYQKKRRDIIICQAAVRRFLVRRRVKKMKVEAKTLSHMQKLHKGLENKIISMQQRIDELNRENNNLKHKVAEVPVLKLKLEAKKTLEPELKTLKASIIDKNTELESLHKLLEEERDEKMQLVEERDNIQEQLEHQSKQFNVETETLRQQLSDVIETAKQSEASIQAKQERLMSEIENNELNEAYQQAIKEKEVIESQNNELKNQLRNMQKPSLHDEFQHKFTRSLLSDMNAGNVGKSNASIEYDLGKSTFECDSTVSSIIDSAQQPSGQQISLLLKLRNILEEEKSRNKALNGQLADLLNRRKPTEDALRVSELEVANEKLKTEYDNLRASIQKGKPLQELDAQHKALQAELDRRREECIQLKAILQEQSHSLRSFTYNINDFKDIHSSELIEAFQAQKLVNRQLESELTALTEENNAHLAEMARVIDELRLDKQLLEDLIHQGLNDDVDSRTIDELVKTERYLRFELERLLTSYVMLQEDMNKIVQKYTEVLRANEKLTWKLQEHGVMVGTTPQKELHGQNAVAQVTKQKSSNYQGVMKFHSNDLDSILQILIVDMTPEIAVDLLPGFPSFVLFMCIRYTDLINADDDVRELLTCFVLHMKNIHRHTHDINTRILWLVNSITLFNLLKQYGDIEEYVRYNTEKQNQQQLKNFNLFEYRRVILEVIINLYQALVTQIQSKFESFIVPALLDNDEIQRSHQSQLRLGRAISMEQSSSPEHTRDTAGQRLINQLEFFYNLMQQSGLDRCYAEQVFHQLNYFICAIAMNCLMLRGDICMWETGMIIRYNLNYIEDWVRNKKMSNSVLSPLAPLTQVSQLLQSRKSEKDVQTIFDMCSALNTAQVLKIMKSYKLDDYENKITSVFIDKLSKKLNERPMNKNDEFTLDQKLIHPFKVVFKYSDVKLEDIELPEKLELDNILSKI